MGWLQTESSQKGAVLLCPECWFPPLLCCLRSSSHLIEEQADSEGWSNRKAGSQLQDSLLPFFLPALHCWCLTPSCRPCCTVVSVSVDTHPSVLVVWSDCSNFAASCSCYYFCQFLHGPPCGDSTLTLTQVKRWGLARRRNRECERAGCDNWHCHPSNKA